MTDDPELDDALEELGLDPDALGDPLVSLYRMDGDDGRPGFVAALSAEAAGPPDEVAGMLAHLLVTLSGAMADQAGGDARERLAALRAALDARLAEDVDVLLPREAMN